MKTQQVPNSPYFICYDENGFFCVSKDKDGKEPISAFETQAFLDAVANGLLYIEKERKNRYPVCQKTSTLPYRECRGEHCSPANLAKQRSFRKASHRANGHGRAMLAPTMRFFDSLRYQRIDEAQKAAFAKGEAEGKENKLIATVKELKEEQALREEQERKWAYEAYTHTPYYSGTRTEWVRLSRGGW